MDNKKLIQLINIGKSNLAMDEDSYRGNLIMWTGKESLKAMSNSELQKAYKGMKSLGFKPTSSFSAGNKKKAISPEFFEKHPEARKLGWVWTVMKTQGHVKNGSYVALEKWAIPQSKQLNNGVEIKKLEWMGNILYQLIEQLKEYHKRLMLKDNWLFKERTAVYDALASTTLPKFDGSKQLQLQVQLSALAYSGNEDGNYSHERLMKVWNAIIYFNGLIKEAKAKK